MNRIFKIDVRVKVRESSNNNEQVYAEVYIYMYSCALSYLLDVYIMRFINYRRKEKC